MMDCYCTPGKLDEITNALFERLRAHVEDKLELLRCPVCPERLEPLLLDLFSDQQQPDGQHAFERVWWTCKGLRSKKCCFPLYIPTEVFWCQRSLEQIQLGIVPLPNLSLLPRRYHHYYPTIFNGNGKERTDPRLGELIEAHARGDSTKARALDAELFTVQSSYQIDSLQSDNIPSISEAPAINPDIDNNDQDKFDGNDSGNRSFTATPKSMSVLRAETPPQPTDPSVSLDPSSMQKKQNIALEQKSPVKLPIIPSEGSAFRIVLSNEAGKNAAEPKEISAVPENEAASKIRSSSSKTPRRNSRRCSTSRSRDSSREEEGGVRPNQSLKHFLSEHREQLRTASLGAILNQPRLVGNDATMSPPLVVSPAGSVCNLVLEPVQIDVQMAEERRPNQAFVEGLSAEESPIHSPAGSVCNLFGHLQTPPSLSRGQNQQQEEERTLDLDADVNYFMELEGEDQQGEDDDEASVEKPIDSAHSSQKNQRKATTIVVSVPLANYHHLQDYQEQQQRADISTPIAQLLPPLRTSDASSSDNNNILLGEHQKQEQSQKKTGGKGGRGRKKEAKKSLETINETISHIISMKKTGGKGGRGSKKGAKKSLTPIPAASESTTERNNQQQPVSSYLETIDETISHIISMVCGKRTADCLTVEVSSKRTEATTTGAVGETVAAAAAAEPPSSCHYGLRSSTLRVRKTAQQVLLSGSYDQSSSSAIPSMPKPSSRYAPYTTARSGKAIKKAEASKTAEISLENELRAEAKNLPQSLQRVKNKVAPKKGKTSASATVLPRQKSPDKLVGKTSDDANETSNSLLVMPESSDKGPSKVPTNNRRSPNKNDQNKTVETEIPSRPSTPTFLEELDKLDFATAKARAASQLSERSAPKDDASDQFIQSAVNTVSGLVEKPSASVFSSSSSKARKRIGASQRKPLGEAAPSSKYPQFEFDPDDPWKGLGDGSGGGEGPAAKKKKTSYGGGPFSCSPIASIHHRHRSSAEVPSADMEALKLELSSARQLEQELRIRLGTKPGGKSRRQTGADPSTINAEGKAAESIISQQHKESSPFVKVVVVDAGNNDQNGSTTMYTRPSTSTRSVVSSSPTSPSTVSRDRVGNEGEDERRGKKKSATAPQIQPSKLFGDKFPELNQLYLSNLRKVQEELAPLRMQIQHPQQKLPAGESGQSSPAATTLAAPSSSTTIFTNQQQQLQSLSHSSWNGGGSGGSQQLYPKPTENERNFNADDQEGFPTLPSMDQLEQTHLHHGEEEEEPSPSISMLFAGENRHHSHQQLDTEDADTFTPLQTLMMDHRHHFDQQQFDHHGGGETHHENNGASNAHDDGWATMTGLDDFLSDEYMLL